MTYIIKAFNKVTLKCCNRKTDAMKKYSMQELKEALTLEAQIVDTKRECESLEKEKARCDDGIRKLESQRKEIEDKLYDQQKNIEELCERQSEYQDVLDLMLNHNDAPKIEKDNYQAGKRRKIATRQKQLLIKEAIAKYKKKNPKENSMPLRWLKEYVESVEGVEIYNVTIFFRKAFEGYELIGGPRNRAITIKGKK